MPLSTSEMLVVRSWVGTTPTDVQLNERFDRLGTVEDTVEETLRAQLSELLGQPASLSLPSGLSVNYGENIRSIKEKLSDIKKVIGGSGGITRLYRPDYR